MNPASTLLLAKLIDVVIAWLAAYPISQEKFQAFRETLQNSIDEGRPLTDDEMADAFAQRDAVNERIEGA